MTRKHLDYSRRQPLALSSGAEGAVQVAAPEVRELIRYDPATGKLFWLERDVSFFRDGKHSAEHRQRCWNSRYAGTEAFTSIDSRGYRQGWICNRHESAHRVIWAVVHGCWPAQEIDHVNGDRSDNRLANLREVTPQENRRNMSISARNTSGVAGVNWDARRETWRARITVNYKEIYLGEFSIFDEARSARKAAEQQYGFHRNHGRLAVAGGSNA